MTQIRLRRLEPITQKQLCLDANNIVNVILVKQAINKISASLAGKAQLKFFAFIVQTKSL